MNEVVQRLLPGPVVTDGAWGTELQLAGLGAGDCTDAWNVQHPDRVEVVARAYVDAGSHVILTNTFGANRLQLARHGLAREVAAINRAGVAISRRAAGTSAAVFASLGPTGRLLGMGQTTESELREVYSEQARALAEAGADALVLETFADLDELRPAIAAAKEMEMTVVASMVFDSGARHDRTMMGTTPERAAEAMAEAGADVIGANCGRGSSGYVAVCQRMRQTVEHPLWIKPNAGLPELIDGKTIYRTSAADFVHDVLDIVAAGASFVGGCCGTNPGYLGAVAMALRDRRANR